MSSRHFVLPILGLLLVAAPLRADPLGHDDRAASLYRDVLRVGDGGKPLLPLSVLTAQDHIEISAGTGLRVLGTGDGQVDIRLPPGRAIELSAVAGKPGEVKHYVVLAQAPAWDFETLRAQKLAWKERGFAVVAQGTGTTYSLAGRMFDTRQTLLCLEQEFADSNSAAAKAQEIGRNFNVDLGVHHVVAVPPSAELVLRERGGSSVEVHARDVLWFEAQRPSGKAAALTVVGVRKGARSELDLPGRVYVVAGRQGLEVVNEADLENVLEGVVASEIFHSAPDAALRAQAVAARTDMLAKVGTRHATDPLAICSEVHCQAYRGLERVSPRIAQAVQDTRGQVLVDAEGRLVDAYYHAVSGGHTENNELVWPGRPQPALRGRTDLVAGAQDLLAGGATDDSVRQLLESKDQSWAAASGMNAEACRWRTERSADELAGQLKRFGVHKPVKALTVVRRGVSGRAIALDVVQSDGSVVKIEGELRIRDALGGSHGPKGLRSSLVIVKAGPAKDGVPQSWTFVGAGFGHGVGMDQTGAVARAKAGQKFDEILLHYYAGATLAKLY
ncbi:MAG: SpoIID/LytB domain-containing protein [Deltaproteobacteria bacterium]|nr:SpoIID/LytB domain-containing protein [Deltaproteobacteria bacterium]